MHQRVISIKSKIEKLIEGGQLEEAKKFLAEFDAMLPGDPDICSMMAVVHIVEGNPEKAEEVIIRGLAKDTVQFDLLYNLAYIYETRNELNKSLDLYLKAETVAKSWDQKLNVLNAAERIRSIDPSVTALPKKKIAFFIKDGMNNFFEDIIVSLEGEYWTRKISVMDITQLEKGMEWADICWFEWCDELIIYASKTELAKYKKIICRIHGYEVYTNNINKVNWDNIDKLIIVAPHVKRIFMENIQYIPRVDIKLIYCGVNVDKYPFKKRTRGFNLGYLGYINFKKNIPHTLEIFKKLYNIDRRYKLYLAGAFQDARTLSYFKYFVKEYKLEEAVIFEGWKDYSQKLEFLDKLNYLVISSIDEGLCYAAAEAMCSGIKPILHNCEGIKDHYDTKYIFNSVDEAVEMILNDEYDSEEYRDFIEKHYSSVIEIGEVRKVLAELLDGQKIKSDDEDPIDTFDLTYAKRYTERNMSKTMLVLRSLDKEEYVSGLDIGCNEGYVIESLLKEGFIKKGFGIDLDRKVVKSDLLSNENFTFFECDIADYKFDKNYDIIIYNSVHHHIYGKYGKLAALETFKDIIDHCNKTLIFETGMITEQGNYYWKDAISKDFSSDSDHFNKLLDIIGPRLKEVTTLDKLVIHGSKRPLLKISLYPKEDIPDYDLLDDSKFSIEKSYYRTVGSKNQKLISEEEVTNAMFCNRVYDETKFFKLLNEDDGKYYFGKKIILNDYKQRMEASILQQAEEPHVIQLFGISKSYGLIFPFLDLVPLDEIDYSVILNKDNLLAEILAFFEYAKSRQIVLEHRKNVTQVNKLIDLVDLHPHNFMVSVRNNEIIDWKVIDFEYYSNSNYSRNMANIQNIKKIIMSC